MRKIKSLFNFVFKNKYLGQFLVNRAGRSMYKNGKSVLAINGKNPKGKTPNGQNPTESLK